MSELKVNELNFFIENKQILKKISLEIKEGQFVGIIGANGSGKSTLLKNIYRIYKPKSGEIKIDEKNIENMSHKEVAKKLAVLAQENSSEFDFKVEDIVKMGRYPYKTIFEDYSKEDMKIVEKMLKKVGLSGFEERSFNNLSGGEKQRVLIARALVQDAKLLILDEPTNHLDVGYQLQVMDIVKELKLTTFAAIHDMNMASMYCDYIIVIKNGEIIASGNVNDILTKDMIKKVFNVDCHIGKNPITGDPHIFYLSEHSHINGIGNGHVHKDGYTGYHKH
ncbi:ABC transporter ATP-binding protein [Clostridium thermobutyricum]|uniref:ABC transporter ATP-binding protein n=1 Tax=Clostridium thermobutyricum TaxID=29372 RepID=UPI0018AC1AB4|nr:ABC transporter ATP-binding protein [Clostridium thermobutyricum]